MKPQETKFSFVYNEIKQSILDGQILHGNTLPSSRMYCEQFHVSRYTINRVFDALREEGLIDIQPRLAPTVVSTKDICNSSNTVFEILKQKEEILQVYQTFALILPSLLVFALQGCDVEVLPHYKQAVKALRLGYTAGGWRPPSKLGYDILRIGGNPLFSELYSTFGLYNKLSFFTEECTYFSKHFLQEAVSVAKVIPDILKGDDPLIMYNLLSDMYQKLTDFIENTLNHLSEDTPKCPSQTGLKFSWNPMRGQDYCYSKIVDDLNLKIGLGEYSVGMFLPYEKQLASQYDVSISTVRKALSELEQRGFVKTLNGKGTIVIEPDSTKLHQLALNSGYVEKSLRYLHALQLMVLIIRPAALAAASQFAGEELCELADRFTSSDSVYLADILEAIMKHTTLEPLYVILSETNHLLEWGHHFAYYPSKKHTLSHLNKQVILALQQLRKGNADSFADGIAECYRYNLVRMKKHMVEKYRFRNVANIRVPEKY
ncbi:GntR family transcriptional regulator [Bariatricus massiliensis]|uniref:GntR family transcriptional regulator n=1 Tax=Bariatricus massiliensis TaxID=1745713 RepID=A0ABS8DN05_9FIRM|nr:MULTISPECIES: GntR family transcriptional regulator [Lachnospiraceae]BDF35882.1 GntR family transcriptional regulator [Lachnospiraceae bacterium]MBO1720693.1 GntR family transcriptional regulator [Extibacter sp. GGCC_0201]MCB7306324.1 GntR family transcriptional regulator [Bariatricus massiliensis]MCB7376824.1 GntR family transcriptional regulator [Bariatricus massiliensis]MCB7389492.1 GntR family transcriptional regulator [Bariatricus massiliensis]